MGFNGAFQIPLEGPPKLTVFVIASDGGGWDHVSVSLPPPGLRTPSWRTMCAVKALFFRDDEWVAQFHPATEAYVNNHAGCLHLWRPQRIDFPQPPSWMVGIKALGTLTTDH